jgi:DNA repair protein RadA/Sms
LAKKVAAKFVCSTCGASFSSWSGKCQNCAEWNTLDEQMSAPAIAGAVAGGKVLKPQAVNKALRHWFK